MRKFFLFVPFAILTTFCFAQESIKSLEDEYYQFLSLQGLIESPTLAYKTLSDSSWDSSTVENDIWSNNNLGKKYTLFSAENPSTNFFIKGLNQSINLKFYSPDLYNSYNTAGPFGQNDGVLWQGRGYNASFSTGIRLEAYGFEFTTKPQVTFSQNKFFDILPSSFGEYGYFWGYSVDAPQRFGNKSFFDYDIADTEARFTWYTFTIGFGTQPIWFGPAQENPLLFSNNAPSFPKFDFGIRKTKITIPFLNWYAGDIEGRVWIGQLSESKFFNDNPDDDKTKIVVFTAAYAPSFIPGLTIGASKVCLTQWLDNDLKYLNPFYKQNTSEDQKASIIFDWKLPVAQFELYSEIGIDDYVPDGKHSLYGYLRYPFHTMTRTFGLRKDFIISDTNHLLLDLELNNTEMSQDFQMQWPYNFGFHHQIIHGYTNKGQWLGSGIGYGGNSQKLSCTWFRPYGSHNFFVGRNNPDNNYIYSKPMNDGWRDGNWFTSYKANFYAGYKASLFITKSFILCPGFTYDLIINPLYQRRNPEEKIYYYDHNFNFNLEIKYQI